MKSNSSSQLRNIGNGLQAMNEKFSYEYEENNRGSLPFALVPIEAEVEM